jgi:GlpG protein
MSLLNNRNWRSAARRSPITAFLMLASVIGAIVVEFSYPPPDYLFYAGIEQGQYYRLISPIFLHFGLLHLVFNCLWLSMLGSRIEAVEGPFHLLLLVVVCGAVSNMVQFYWSNSIYFGGMSGVIYALLGYLWIKHKIAPQTYPALPQGLMGFMVGWLVLCMTGILEIAVGIGVANAAHLGGLIIGLIIGIVFATLNLSRDT